MYKPLTEEELEFLECFYNPACLIESTTPITNIEGWNVIDSPCVELRTYQLPFIAYDVCLEDDNKKTDYENFKLREGAGTLLVISARKIGKTFVALVRNILVKLVTYSGKEMTISCYDALHVKKVADEICDYLENHLFFRQYKKGINRSPVYDIKTKNGNWLQSVNENITGKKIGQQWWSHHTDFNFQDEIQATTNEAYDKKIDARGEKGCIEILAGIPLICKGSPLDNFLKVSENKNRVVRLPQYISPYWNEQVKAVRVKEYGGENSTGYLINVAAETVEGAYGAFNLAKIRELCYREDKIIKEFEVSDKDFFRFRNILALSPALNATKTYVAADVGSSAATEIIVVNEVNGIYKLAYNITSYKLTDKELFELITYIAEKTLANYVGVDCTIMGAPVHRQLVEVFGSKKVIWVAFNENVTIGFERNEEGNFVYDNNGNPIERLENTLVYSVQRLRELFYEGRIEVPAEWSKFDEQFSAYLQLVKGSRVSFDSAKEDHLVQAFQVFSMLQWRTELDAINPLIKNNKLSLGAFKRR